MLFPYKKFNQVRKEGQAQLLRWYPSLSPAEKKQLLADIDRLDFEMIRAAAKPFVPNEGEISPIAVTRLEEINEKREAYRELGIKALSEGKLAAVLLAGGQGTRLGFDHAKGCYNVALSGSLFLFQILIENLKDNVALCGRPVPLYIMTSDLNYDETVGFFREKAFFGYPEDCVHFFRQDMAPSLTADGKVMLEEKYHISYTPNGNGGWFSSLKRAGLLEQMKAEGVEWLNVFSVDNVLQQIADPVFLGAVLADGSYCGAKVIAKATPEEKIGAICLRGGRTTVVEYSELSEEMRYAKDEAGNFLYHYGVTLNYLFHLQETEKRAGEALPLHKAFKKIRCLNEKGESVLPETPNGYKIETFIFDILECYPKVTVFEVSRKDEFAPIKNASGTDSPESARELLLPKRLEWKALLTKE